MKFGEYKNWENNEIYVTRNSKNLIEVSTKLEASMSENSGNVRLGESPKLQHTEKLVIPWKIAF